jgi:site-specific DNA-methyltransferase (adenine-specific)
MPGDLYYGDNLDVLRFKIPSESVDLIYLDPPFNSDRTYNLIHKGSQSQEHAFVDTWHWDDKAERAFAELTGHAPANVRVPSELSAMMVALKDFLYRDHRDTLAYLSMMAIRLVEMRRVLRKTGSIYLHCDPTASHYLKMILDSIFGAASFQNEIIWKRQSAHNSARRYGPIHDVILFYSKTEDYTWNDIFSPYSDTYLEAFYTHVDPDGRRWRRSDLTGAGIRHGETGKSWRSLDVTAKGRHWCKPPSDLEAMDAEGKIHWPAKSGGMPMLKRYLDKQPGVSLQDVWTDIKIPHNLSAERTGYATQKPLELLERILQSSSNIGDLVFDPFCGCGTTIEVAESIGRKWIGIDIAIRAVDVIKQRLDEKFKKRVWTEYGEPSGTEEAARLAETNPYDFQWWAVRKVGGQPPKGEKKKGGDGGIDGELTLRDFDSEKRRRVIVSVKGGHTLTPDFVKALKTTVDMEKADYGILLTMHSPSQGMRDVARECGMVPWAKPSDGKLGHRIRIVTVAELFAGSVQLPGRNETPRSQSSPPPAEAREGETLHLPFAPRVPAGMKGGVARAKNPKKGPAKTYEQPTPEVMAVADSVRPKKK